jgi:hypothetical protein
MTKKISGGVVHDLPSDLRKALSSDATALAAWEDITPLARNEWICWVISVKQPGKRGNMLNGYARNLRKECAALVVGMAVFTERIRH